MADTDERPTRIAGVEVGTAVLSSVSCLAFAIAVAALTGSAGLTLLAVSSLLVGIMVALSILPSER
ncbi:hypothetical protein [Nocardia bovistercoris]|uniref:Uncharacterized protein n=1 Tax=Nocardia bovistercoris TaxID=2785916 RepID=A0A931N7B1_9NOCA|nr:hypothetical protein [Nocardia bovistercoris]MBH0781597.1 hypothetical protein [Nocardia bovistercoris]